jgi:UPF0271 protein
MKISVDINADLGEGAGHDAELLQLISSASIACGLHAGDPVTISGSITAARDAHVAVGAHPSFADREQFGRREIELPPEHIFALLVYQLGAFNSVSRAAGVRPNHVKPHGALYNMAVRDAGIADAVIRAISAIDSSLMLFAPATSVLARLAEQKGIVVAREVFADRNYMPDGRLVSRSHPEALLHGPSEAAGRVLRMLHEGVVKAIDGSDVPIQADTICVHGDTPGAVQFVRELRSRLQEAGVTIAAAKGSYK